MQNQNVAKLGGGDSNLVFLDACSFSFYLCPDSKINEIEATDIEFGSVRPSSQSPDVSCVLDDVGDDEWNVEQETNFEAAQQEVIVASAAAAKENLSPKPDFKTIVLQAPVKGVQPVLDQRSNGVDRNSVYLRAPTNIAVAASVSVSSTIAATASDEQRCAAAPNNEYIRAQFSHDYELMKSKLLAAQQGGQWESAFVAPSAIKPLRCSSPLFSNTQFFEEDTCSTVDANMPQMFEPNPSEPAFVQENYSYPGNSNMIYYQNDNGRNLMLMQPVNSYDNYCGNYNVPSYPAFDNNVGFMPNPNFIPNLPNLVYPQQQQQTSYVCNNTNYGNSNNLNTFPSSNFPPTNYPGSLLPLQNKSVVASNFPVRKTSFSGSEMIGGNKIIRTSLPATSFVASNVNAQSSMLSHASAGGLPMQQPNLFRMPPPTAISGVVERRPTPPYVVATATGYEQQPYNNAVATSRALEQQACNMQPNLFRTAPSTSVVERHPTPSYAIATATGYEQQPYNNAVVTSRALEQQACNMQPNLFRTAPSTSVVERRPTPSYAIATATGYEQQPYNNAVATSRALEQQACNMQPNLFRTAPSTSVVERRPTPSYAIATATGYEQQSYNNAIGKSRAFEQQACNMQPNLFRTTPSTVMTNAVERRPTPPFVVATATGLGQQPFNNAVAVSRASEQQTCNSTYQEYASNYYKKPDEQQQQRNHILYIKNLINQRLQQQMQTVRNADALLLDCDELSLAAAVETQLKIPLLHSSLFECDKFRIHSDDHGRSMAFSEISKYIDAHCHLEDAMKSCNFRHYVDFKDQFVQQWSPKYTACITDFCHPHKHTEEFTNEFDNILENDDVYAAVGCHPLEAALYESDTEAMIACRADHPKVVAIGEMGLDYSLETLSHKERETQRIVFERQLMFAIREVSKPIVLHCRAAEDDCLAMLKRIVPHNHRIHWHNFYGTDDTLKKCQMFTNLYFGVSTGVYDCRQMDWFYRTCRLDRLLIETNAPHNLPKFYRTAEFGQLTNNHSGTGALVGMKLAEIRSDSEEVIFEALYENTMQMYPLLQTFL